MFNIKNIIGCGLMFLTCTAGWAQGLMNYESRAALDKDQTYYLRMAQSEASNANVVVSSVNFDLLRDEGFSLNLPDGQSFEIIKAEEENLDSKRTFYYGEVSGSEGDAHFIRKGNMLTGHIAINDKIYSIRPLGGEKHAFIEIDQSSWEACSNNDQTRQPAESEASKAEIERMMPREWQNEGDVNESRNAGDCRIRVLVAYTKAVGDALADPLSTVNLAIQLTNTGYSRSGITQRIELARAFEVNYTEHSSQQTNLSRFTNNSDGFMDNVHSERTRWRADMCHLLTNNGSGIAWVSSNFGSVFAVTNYTYINGYTFGHEMGHNHKAQHDPSAYSGTSNFRGYGHPSGYFRTVMAYGSACGTSPCPRVNDFSGPGNHYYHSGTATWYVTGTATQNNVKTHNDEGSKIANHYKSYTNAHYTSTTVYNDEAIHAAAAQTIQNNAASPNFVYNYGSEGSFKASQRVTLVPGFRARSGSSFRAYLENCTPLRVANEDTSENTEESLGQASSNEEFSFSATDYSLTTYPNPFKGQATVEYTLPEHSKVNLYVRNTLGQIVSSVLNSEEQAAGNYKRSLDASNLAQGVYYLVLETENERMVEKIVISN